MMKSNKQMDRATAKTKCAVANWSDDLYIRNNELLTEIATLVWKRIKATGTLDINGAVVSYRLEDDDNRYQIRVIGNGFYCEYFAVLIDDEVARRISRITWVSPSSSKSSRATPDELAAARKRLNIWLRSVLAR